MSDLDLIRDLTPDIPLPGPAELAPARSRLAAAIAGERRTGSRPAAVSGRWRGWLALAGAAAAALAAGAAGLLIATTAPGIHPGRSAGATGGTALVRVDATAASVLHRAALAALRLPAATPRPDQFVYVEWANGIRADHLFQAWLSVDGTRNGLIRSGGTDLVDRGCRDRDGHRAGQNQGSPRGSAASYSCTPAPAFLPGMPASPRGVLRYLEKTYGVRLGTSQKSRTRLGQTVDGLLTFTYLLPRQRAALYELLAQTPGFSVVPDAADPTGRRGIGASWHFGDGNTMMIIFDRRTYAELGLIVRGSGKYRHYADGRAVFKIAIVSRAGQLP
jgi:hypothetical protein